MVRFCTIHVCVGVKLNRTVQAYFIMYAFLNVLFGQMLERTLDWAYKVRRVRLNEIVFNKV